MGSLFTFLSVSFDAQTYVDESQLTYFVVAYAFGAILKSLPTLSTQRYSPMFSAKNFIVLTLILRFLICFEFIVLYDVKHGSNSPFYSEKLLEIGHETSKGKI